MAEIDAIQGAGSNILSELDGLIKKAGEKEAAMSTSMEGIGDDASMTTLMKLQMQMFQTNTIFSSTSNFIIGIKKIYDQVTSSLGR